MEHSINEAIVLEEVAQIRRNNPFMGGKKLYHCLQGQLCSWGIKMGRDKFFGLLSQQGLLVKKRRKYVSTTDSYHRFHTYKNQLKGMELTSAHQGWVGDITYVRVDSSFMYLFLLTDAFSRKIVGWHLSDSLAIEGALSALKKAIKQCPEVEGLIHHSDRGIQYCSNAYTTLLKKHKIRISMTEENHCYENAKAERVNGILKGEYGLDSTFNRTNIHAAVQQAIKSYNTERPHWGLKLATPQMIHSAA